MGDRPSDGQNILDLLEEKIMEWELDRTESKIRHEIHMAELLKRVKRIKATNCGPCE